MASDWQERIRLLADRLAGETVTNEQSPRRSAEGDILRQAQNRENADRGAREVSELLRQAREALRGE
jgi:hypothetical protein